MGEIINLIRFRETFYQALRFYRCGKISMMVPARNVISGNGEAGVAIQGRGATANHFWGNLIGPAIDGHSPVGGQSLAGVLIGDPTGALPAGLGNFIGGDQPGAGNIISGNEGHGVLIAGGVSGNYVVGNTIGLAELKNAALPNSGNGVVIDNGIDNFIGGPTAAESNSISANLENGVLIKGLLTIASKSKIPI